MEKLSTFHFPQNGIECYYHTGSVENALDILEFNHLFGSLPSRVNDPDDLKISIQNLEECPWAKSTGQSSPIIETAIKKAISNKMVLDRVYRFVCLAKAQQVDNEPASELCFWNVYANHFKGVRFKFLVDKEFLCIPSPQEAMSDNIDYAGRLATIDASRLHSKSDIESLIKCDSFLKDLCYSKAPKWKTEHEFRLGSIYCKLHLAMSRITSKEERFFVFNPCKLREVTVGCNAIETDVERLRLMLQDKGVPLRRVKLNLQYETLSGHLDE